MINIVIFNELIIKNNNKPNKIAHYTFNPLGIIH